MSDVAKRVAMLEAYRPDAGERVNLLGVAYLETPVKVFDMADDMVRLHERLAAVEAERDDAIIDKRLSDEQRAKWMAENVALLHRAERAERILAALREPSKEVFGAALRAYSESLSVTHKPRFISAIRAAVTAAEQEVGRE